jgi:hypothetical protein
MYTYSIFVYMLGTPRRTVIQQLLELGGCSSSIMCQQVGLATEVRRVEYGQS